jgi:hypothetical protein
MGTESPIFRAIVGGWKTLRKPFSAVLRPFGSLPGQKNPKKTLRVPFTSAIFGIELVVEERAGCDFALPPHSTNLYAVVHRAAGWQGFFFREPQWPGTSP